jgi:hypothetical protein
MWNVNGSQTQGENNILPYPHTAHEQNTIYYLTHIWHMSKTQYITLPTYGTWAKHNILPYPHTAHEQNILIEQF